MPNWTNNIVEVRGPRKIVKELVDHKFDFMKIYPYPKELDITAGREGPDDSPEQMALVAKEESNLEKHGYRNWYDWCVAEWGTKWNAGGEDNGDMIVDYDEDVDDTGIALFTFDTAWAPPVGIFQKLKELHPDLEVSGRYYEPGMGYFGIWDDGDDRGYDFEHLENGSKDDFWDTEDGMLLDENFGIVEMLQESEADEMDEDAQKVRDFVEGEAQNTEQTA
jgi:hypothetical protein